MSARKKVSNCSEPTQSERPKRFIRRNSFHTLMCRSGSLKKYQTNSEELSPEQPPSPLPVPSKPHIKTPPIEPDSPQLFRTFCQPHEISLKRGSGSMRIDPSNRERKEQS